MIGHFGNGSDRFMNQYVAAHTVIGSHRRKYSYGILGKGIIKVSNSIVSIAKTCRIKIRQRGIMCICCTLSDGTV